MCWFRLSRRLNDLSHPQTGQTHATSNKSVISSYRKGREIYLTFVVGVDGPNVPFEVFAPDEALAAAINMAGIRPGALLRLVFAERIHRLP